MRKEGLIPPGIQKLLSNWVICFGIHLDSCIITFFFPVLLNHSCQQTNILQYLPLKKKKKSLPLVPDHLQFVWFLCFCSEENSKVDYPYCLYFLSSHFLSIRFYSHSVPWKTLFPPVAKSNVPLTHSPHWSWSLDCNCQGWSVSTSYWNPLASGLPSPDLALTSLAS